MLSPHPTRCAASCARWASASWSRTAQHGAPSAAPSAAPSPIRPPPRSSRCAPSRRRHQQLSAEIGELDALITPLVTQINPALCALLGVGPDVAGQLLVTAGDNPDRLRSEAAFAMLCGVAPLPASSGRTHRHRLNRGGDRHANSALYRIVLCRLRCDPRTRAYAQRRTAEGMSKKRDHPLPQTLRRPRGLHRPAQPPPFLRPGQHLAPRRRSQRCSARSAARTNYVDTELAQRGGRDRALARGSTRATASWA